MSQDATVNGSAKRNISRGLVALFKEQTGRGPTSAQVYVNDDFVTVILQDMLTPVEKTLTDSDRAPVVHDMREALQSAICDEATALVERETGRTVKVLLSDHCVVPDYAIECFILEPEEPDSDDSTPCEDRAAQEEEAAASPGPG